MGRVSVPVKPLLESNAPEKRRVVEQKVALNQAILTPLGLLPLVPVLTASPAHRYCDYLVGFFDYQSVTTQLHSVIPTFLRRLIAVQLLL